HILAARTLGELNFGVQHAAQIVLQAVEFLTIHNQLQKTNGAGNLPAPSGKPQAGKAQIASPMNGISNIWFMARAGSESLQPASPTMRAGTPATVTFAGTDFSTTEPAATRAHAPTSILPSTLAPAESRTPRRIFGWRSPTSLPVPPRVTPCSIETSSSTTAVAPITTPVA